MSVVEPGGSADVPEIPDGLYQATVKAVKDVALEQPDSFGNTDKIEITLAFTDADGVSQTLDPRVNRKWGEKASLFMIAVACGCGVEPYEPFDTEALVGKKVNILVETPEEGKWPRVKSYAKVRNGKAATAAVEPTVTGLALVKATGEIDFTVFWKEVNKTGATRESVAAMLDNNLEKLMTMEPTDVADLLEVIKGAAVA